MATATEKPQKGRLQRKPAERRLDTQHRFLKIAAIGICVLDILVLLLSTFLLATGMQLLTQVCGYLILVLMPLNILLPLWNRAMRDTKTLYLFLMLTGSLLVPTLGWLSSTNVKDMNGTSLPARLILLAMLGAGGYLAYRCSRYRPTIADAIVRPKTFAPIRRFWEGFLGFLCFLLLVTAGFLVFGIYADEKHWSLEVSSASFTLFWSWLLFSAVVLVIHLGRPHRSKVLQAVSFLLGLGFFVAFSLPMVRILPMAIGTKTQNAQSRPATNRAFAFSPFDYLFGIDISGYTLFPDIPYLVGTEGVDAEKTFAYDLYLPSGTHPKPPEGYPVLIRIHGGSWTSGDKGAYNFSAMNKYFAGLGYAVFDIQYGLSAAKNPDVLASGDPVFGNFDIDDMVRHIGIFTIHLAEQKEKYHLNTQKVFLSGASAGGQLALSVGLALESGNYPELFGEINILGIIPFYPAVGLSPTVGIEGNDLFLDPSPLVTKDSPPVLIYQGDHDGTVNPAVAERFRSAYLGRGGENCSIVSMPYGSHASDLYFSGYYNQVFLYQMERFMQQLTVTVETN